MPSKAGTKRKRASGANDVFLMSGALLAPETTLGARLFEAARTPYQWFKSHWHGEEVHHQKRRKTGKSGLAPPTRAQTTRAISRPLILSHIIVPPNMTRTMSTGVIRPEWYKEQKQFKPIPKRYLTKGRTEADKPNALKNKYPVEAFDKVKLAHLFRAPDQTLIIDDPEYVPPLVPESPIQAPSPEPLSKLKRLTERPTSTRNAFATPITRPRLVPKSILKVRNNAPIRNGSGQGRTVDTNSGNVDPAHFIQADDGKPPVPYTEDLSFLDDAPPVHHVSFRPNVTKKPFESDKGITENLHLYLDEVRESPCNFNSPAPYRWVLSTPTASNLGLSAATNDSYTTTPNPVTAHTATATATNSSTAHTATVGTVVSHHHASTRTAATVVSHHHDSTAANATTIPHHQASTATASNGASHRHITTATAGSAAQLGVDTFMHGSGSESDDSDESEDSAMTDNDQDIAGRRTTIQQNELTFENLENLCLADSFFELEPSDAIKKKLSEEAAALHEKQQKEAEKVRKAQEKLAAEKAEAKRKEEEAAAKKAAAETEAKRKEEQEVAKKAAALHPLIKPLSDQWQQKLKNAAAKTKNGRDQIDLTGTGISTHTMGTLLPRQFGGAAHGWLNDDVVNVFLQKLIESEQAKAGYKKTRNPPPPPVHAFASQWYTNTANDFVSTARWVAKAGLTHTKLYDCNLILFPICQGSHWTLLAIKPGERKILHVDSLHGSSKRYIDRARAWLKHELDNWYYEAEWEVEEWKSQHQLNGSDCGVFTCLNALALIRGAGPTTIAVDDGMDAARQYIAATLLGMPIDNE